MKKDVHLIVVIPVGPGCIPEFVLDTIDSIRSYTTANRAVIIIDDSGKGTGNALQEVNPTLEVLVTPRRYGLFGGLYISLARAFSYILERYTFAALLRLDSDALIIGSHPENDAIAAFKANTRLGLLGQYPCDYYGVPWDTSWQGTELRKQSHNPLSLLRHPKRGFTLRRLAARAQNHGYEFGDFVFGGAYFFSQTCLQRLREHGLLPNVRLWSTYVQEDHLFGLLVKSAGFDLGDLATGDLPFACAWRELPAAPDELLQRRKKIVHSTRRWGTLDEVKIRTIFRSARNGTALDHFSGGSL
jgi:hypothetical protein